MELSFTPDAISDILDALHANNSNFHTWYPGDRVDRQPVHTVYGGANLFKAGSNFKLGELALRALDEYAPQFAIFAKVLRLPGHDHLPDDTQHVAAMQRALEKNPEAMRVTNYDAWLAWTICTRVREKLKKEPIEDSRIDFEDGYGNRPDDEEDGHAIQVADEIAKGMAEKSLPPFLGIRIKPLTEESHGRSIRTLDLVLTRMAKNTGGKLPKNFVVTLPKVTHPGHVTALCDLLDRLEKKTGIAKGAIKVDLMIEMTQSIIDHTGKNNVYPLVQAGRGRVVSCAFGTYDYTATCNITAAHQVHRHPSADFARHVLQVSLAGTAVTISDGATNRMPIGPHRPTADKPLTGQQIAENRLVVHDAWKFHFDNIEHSLRHAYYQGWDLNPAQLPIRYAAVYKFYLDGLADASRRLNAFIERAAQATLSGNTFDDAATGQGLLNFFLRGMAAGALTKKEVLATGITLEELRGRSFVKIVANRSVKKKK